MNRLNKMSEGLLNGILIEDLDVSVRTLTICKKLEIKTLLEFNEFPWYSRLAKSTNLGTSSGLFLRLSLKSLNRLLGEVYEESNKRRSSLIDKAIERRNKK